MTKARPEKLRASDLRITKVRCTAVSVPMRDAYSFSAGKVSGVTKVIVEVETSEGITGVGETFPSWSKEILEKTIAPRLIGENPFNLERIQSKCLPTNANPGLPYIDFYNLLPFAGAETALWDIMGKFAGVPSAMLMGGVYRTDIPFCDFVLVSGSHEHPKEYIESVAKESKRLKTQYKGSVIGLKVGVLRPSDEIEMVRNVREAVGESTAIRIDANCAWSESTAMNTIRKLEEFDVANIEEPCATLESDSKVRRVIRTPISAHSTRVMDVARAKLDSAVINPLLVGGFARTKKLVALAEGFDLNIWLHSRGELGFGQAAYMHFIASNRHIVLPNQTIIRTIEHLLTKEGKPKFMHGFMPLPDQEGLGVTLDTTALDKYRELFEETGEFENQTGSGRSPPFY